MKRKIQTSLLMFGLLLCGRAWGFGGEEGGYASPYLQNDASMNFSDWTSVISNPALLTEVDQKEITIGGLRLLEGAGYSYVSYAHPLFFRHTVAATLFSSGLTGIDEYTQSGVATGKSLSFGDMNFLMTYAFRVLPALSVGTNVSLIYRNLEMPSLGFAKKIGFGFDGGVVWNPINHYRHGNLNVGLLLQNVYKTKIKEDTLATSSATQFPRTVRASASYGMLRNRLVFDFETTIIDLIGMKDEFSIDTAGSSVTLPVARPVKLGVHARWFFTRGLAVKLGYNNNDIPSMGLLLLGKRINIFRALRLDYDFWYDSKGTGVSNALRVAARVGKTREEIESRRLYNKLIIAPMQDFDEAMRLYLAGMYWEASFAFGKVIALYPGFHKIDMAAFYMGKCYEYLQMNQAARSIYSDALKKYTTSEMRPRYIYQLQNLDYKENKFDAALKNYAFITNLYASSTIRPSADYVAGQIYYSQGNYNSARQVFAQIPAGDENYGYAQFTLAMINLLEKAVPGAIENLNKVLSIVPQSNSDRVLQEAAATKLGHIYFEQVDLTRAVQQYNKVPLTSRYADEALLATAWCYIKANRKEAFQMAVNKTDQLIGNHPKSMLVPEAYLAKGYCFSQMADFSTAKELFQTCIDLCRKAIPGDPELKQREQEFNGAINTFAGTEKEIIANALRKPDDQILAARTGYQEKFSEFRDINKQKLIFLESLESIRMFRRSRDKVQKDAEFALATVDNLSSSRKKEQIIKQYEKDQTEIDKEIQQLQNELKNLEK